MTRQTFDLIPLQKFAVGFDQLFNEMDRLVEQQNSNTYPPYNIVRTDADHFLIEIAVAGFSESELDVTLENHQLRVTGNKSVEVSENNDATVRQYLHRGIGFRSFTRTFHLDRHIEVAGAKIENGLLIVYLERVIPDELKPRKIDIKS